MKRLDTTISTVRKYIAQNPFKSFYIALGIFVITIGLSHFLSQKAPDTKKTIIPSKQVRTFKLSDNTSITTTGTVEKNGVTTIVALSGGVVQRINLKEGSTVYKGQAVVSLSSNYQGGNAAGIQSALAKLGYDQTLATYDNQKTILQKQKEIAEKVDANADEARDKNPMKLKEDEALSNLQKDITLKQLENGQTSLDFGREMSRLQYQLASVQAASMYPASPFAGVVQKIFVRKGQFVSPGTPIATVASANTTYGVKVSAYTTENIARQISLQKPSMVMIGKKAINIIPYFVSTEPVQGNLFAVFFLIPASQSMNIADDSTLAIKLTLEAPSELEQALYIPLDGVYQTAEESLVYLYKNKKAHSKKVELGTIYGSYVQVTKGLTSEDTIILDRSVIDGESVTLWQK